MAVRGSAYRNRAACKAAPRSGGGPDYFSSASRKRSNYSRIAGLKRMAGIKDEDALVLF